MKFSISILAVNGVEMTKRCIDSVFRGGGDFEILLTDNGGTDGIAAHFEHLAALNDSVSVVHNAVNKGFSEPNNEALSRAKGDFFVTLNNDATVPHGWLEKLARPFSEHSTAAISGPIGSCCALRHDTHEFLGDLGHDFEYVEGSCLCIPTELARKFTLFAPYMHFAYGEDVDLSLRMRARGLTIHQVPFRIAHERGVTARSIKIPIGIHVHNQRMLADRWGGYHRHRRLDLPIIIRREAAMGDVLLITPLIRALRDQQPKSEIWVETKCREVLANNPNVHVVRPHQSIPFLVRQNARYIDLDMAYENMTQTHIVDAYFEKALIIPSQADYRRTELYFTPEDERMAERNLPGEGWVAVHAGTSTWSGKDWGFDKFNQLCEWFQKTWKVVLVGNDYQPQCPCSQDLRNLTTPSQLAAVLKRCAFFIGIDSFPLHVAESVGIPVIGLFGVTDPRFIMTGYTSLSIMGKSNCSGERHRVTGRTHIDCDGSCINSISVEQVMEKVSQLTHSNPFFQKRDKIYSRVVPSKNDAPVRYREEMSVVGPYQ